MSALEQQEIESERRQSNAEQPCPECGAIMMEADRRVEGRALFARCTCGRVGCGRQRLKKFVKDTRNV